jgi:transposase-like protein
MSDTGAMRHMQSLSDDATCVETVRALRWPDGVQCPTGCSSAVPKHGRDATPPERQRYLWTSCERRFDDVTDTVFAGQHQPLRVWRRCLYFMGLNLSNQHIAQELDRHPADVHQMTRQLRHGIGSKKPAPT